MLKGDLFFSTHEQKCSGKPGDQSHIRYPRSFGPVITLEWITRISVTENIRICHTVKKFSFTCEYNDEKKFTNFRISPRFLLWTSSVVCRRDSSTVFGNLRLSSEIFWNNRELWENGWILLNILNKQDAIGAYSIVRDIGAAFSA